MVKIKKIQLPDSPGVYFFKSGATVLYIGKATSLRDRVKSYFNKDLAVARGPRLVAMLEQATAVTWQTTDSVLEALILEAALIKKYQPKYNARERDDKSFNYVVITKESWPRVLTRRGRELEQIASSKVLGSSRQASPRLSSQKSSDLLGFHPRPDFFEGNLGSAIFGPFPHGGELREALKIIRRIFPFLDDKSGLKGRDDFYRQLGLAPGSDDRSAYLRNIRNLKLFFAGKKLQVLKNLKREMKILAKERKFEEAAMLRNQIFALKHINDVALIKSNKLENQSINYRIEAYDIAHTAGKETVGVMTVVENGEVKKSDYRKFKIRGRTTGTAYEKCLAEPPRQAAKEIRGLFQKHVPEVSVDDTANLAEILERRANHPEWPWPDLVVMDGGKAQLNRAEKTLRQVGLMAPVVSVVKDERHRPREILGNKELAEKYEAEILLANSEAHRYALAYHRKRRGKMI